MSILKFLLSPLLNEHGYTTLPTAQTASGKPVTTGIFANIKAALDGFNDGTNIGTRSIGARASFNRNVIEDNWAKFVNNAILPSHWTLLSGAAPNVGATTITNEACTYLNTAGASTPTAGLDIGFNAASGKTAIMGLRAGVGASGSGANWGMYLTANGSVNNYIALYFTATNLVCESSTSGGVVTTTNIVTTYAANTFYDVWFTYNSSGVSAYLGNTLITSWSTNLPTGMLRPMIFYANGTGTQYIYITKTIFTPDY